ncbi:MAG TPA: DUF1553 domain-containing protein, partial [Pirellulaceae bacterium]|nr:DUF1553 domain-containing protein [Pirellulaceae bacterium]
QADTPEFANLIDDFEVWAAVRGRDNVPYDRMVHELLTITRLPSRAPGQQPGERVSPVGFLAASQFKPENLAANTTRSFLGLNLDCAQCHNHPFSRWTRGQFWQTAAFFAPPTKTSGVMLDKLQLTIPDTERSVAATLLDDKPVLWPEKLEAETGRRLLADWIASKENPYFAKNAVNRVWAHLYGTGLVEPLDDLSEENPPSHPALLDDLSAAFVASGFDVKYLTQAIVLSRAYQLSTALPDGATDDDPRLFARMPVRGLTGEQLYDSSRVAAGLPVERDDLLTSRDSGQRQRFVTQMLIARPVEAERSIVQALALMNGSLTMELTTAGKSPTLLAAAESPFLNNQGKVETLFFAALNRNPTAQESSRLVNYIEQGGEARTSSQSLGDIFWALLNSSEFNTNH